MAARERWGIIGCSLLLPLLCTTLVHADGITCSSLTSRLSNDKNYYILTATSSGDGAIRGYTFSFGDHQTYHFSFDIAAADRHTASTTHTYLQPGHYTASVSVDGKSGHHISAATCRTAITIGSPTNTLPDAGAPLPVGLAATGAVIGTTAHYWWQHRRTARQRD